MDVLIVEDELPAARRLQQMVLRAAPAARVVAVCESVAEAVGHLESADAPPTLGFFDIQLADGLSFEIFERIRVAFPVIFTTAYDAYALRAFKVNSVDYLLKPITEEALDGALRKFRDHYAAPPLDVAALLRALQPATSRKTRFLVKVGERLLSVDQREVAYFTSEEKVVILYTQDGRKYAVDHSLDDLEGLLDPQHFFRLNRQFIARIEALGSVHQYFNGKLKIHLQPAAGRDVVVSREKAPLFRAWLDG
ncbi:MAG: LytTR family DNA-binding domain-containing protein [Catalinimonas sp.]